MCRRRPPIKGFHTYGEYTALRNYEAQELAVRRGDPVWLMAYGRAAMQADSGIGSHTEANWYTGGDLVVATNVNGKFSFANGIALVGAVDYTNLRGKNVRLSDGSIAASLNNDLLSGHGGLALELGRDSELRLEAVHGNGVTGALVNLYSGGPNGFGYLKLDYNKPYLDTPRRSPGAPRQLTRARWATASSWPMASGPASTATTPAMAC